MLFGLIKFIKSAFLRLWNYYNHLSLRVKFTLLIGIIILIVIVSLSFAVFEAEKYVLREKIEKICRLSVQNLSSVAVNNLLTGKHVPIQDAINDMTKLNLEGFEKAFVMDGNGKIIAHSNPQKITEIDSTYRSLLDSDKQFFIDKQDNRSEYLQVLIVQRNQNQTNDTEMIGLAGVEFSHIMIDRALARSRNVIIAITVGIMFLSVLLVHLLSRQLAGKIIHLSNGVKEIAKGNLDIKIGIHSGDELGLLATEFNKMVKSLREKLHMQKFVSRLTVDMIQSQSGDSTSPTLINKKEIAVLFSDIRGFTRLSEKLDPERLMEVINVYLKLQSESIEENGGLIDKFAGDQIMAIFQSPEASDNAVRAAIAIQKQITEINKQRRKNNQEYITVGIGINYGHAMIGSMGASSRMDYTAIGNVVNLASKLCNFARAGHIVVTQNIIRNLNGSFSVIKMEPVALGGRKRPVPIYRVVYNQ